MGIMGLWTCLVGNRGMIHSMTIEKHPSNPHSLRSAPVSGRNYQDVWFQTWANGEFSPSATAGIQKWWNQSPACEAFSFCPLVWTCQLIHPWAFGGERSGNGSAWWAVKVSLLSLGRLDHPRSHGSTAGFGPLGGLPIDFYTIEMQDVESGDPSPDQFW